MVFQNAKGAFLGLVLRCMFGLCGWLNGVDVCLCFCVFNGFVFFVVYLNVLGCLFFKCFFAYLGGLLFIGGLEGLGCLVSTFIACFSSMFPNIMWPHNDPTLDQIWTQLFGRFLVMSVGLFFSETTICVAFQQKCILKPTPEILGKHFFEHNCTNNKTYFGCFCAFWVWGVFAMSSHLLNCVLLWKITTKTKRWTMKSKTISKYATRLLCFFEKRQQTKHSNLKNTKPKTQQKEEPKNNWTTTSEATLHQKH